MDRDKIYDNIYNSICVSRLGESRVIKPKDKDKTLIETVADGLTDFTTNLIKEAVKEERDRVAGKIRDFANSSGSIQHNGISCVKLFPLFGFIDSFCEQKPTEDKLKTCPVCHDYQCKTHVELDEHLGCAHPDYYRSTVKTLEIAEKKDEEEKPPIVVNNDGTPDTVHCSEETKKAFTKAVGKEGGKLRGLRLIALREIETPYNFHEYMRDKILSKVMAHHVILISHINEMRRYLKTKEEE